MSSASRLFVVAGLAAWAGTTLLLSELRWMSRPPLVARLRPYAPGGLAGRARGGPAHSFADVIGPLCRRFGERAAQLLGVGEELGGRLERIHSPLDVTAFRVRQVGWSVAAFGLGALGAVASRPPAVIALLLFLGSPVLGFLVLEQQVASQSARWRRRVFLELPVVAEQLAMLLSAGYSLGAALNRMAARGEGCCARDLRRVTSRIRHGLSEADALREWATTADVEAVSRLVPILALSREGADLGRLVSEEARSIRREVQRELVETMERRGQQVWIPVTVATLVPGVIFLAIPFIEALRLFSG